MNFEIKLDIYYQNFDNFKQKSALMLQNLFVNGRINDYIKFRSYGTITPLDDRHKKIQIEELNKFTRSKVNCLIYDLTYNKYNPGKYDKLFIYSSTTSRNTTWYGYVLYNSETGKTMHKYCLEHLDDKLYQYIYMSIVKLPNDKLWKYYSDKYDALKKKDIPNVKTIEEWREMRKWYDDFVHTPFDNKNICESN